LIFFFFDNTKYLLNKIEYRKTHRFCKFVVTSSRKKLSELQNEHEFRSQTS
jgi:hypothetical protein